MKKVLICIMLILCAALVFPVNLACSPSTPPEQGSQGGEEPGENPGGEEPGGEDPIPPATLAAREATVLSEGWEFKKDNGHWSDVSIPHTWNASDGQDGGTYDRTVGWYRRTLTVEKREHRRQFLRFEGVNTRAEVYVNGEEAGSHVGGYTAFALDITELLKEGENLLEVRVDNRESVQAAPLSGDFTIFGGIYRDVTLYETDDVHVTFTDAGSFGLYLTQKEVSADSAGLEVRAEIVNDSEERQEVKISAVLSHPEEFEEVAGANNLLFDPAEMSGGGEVARLEETVAIAPGESYTFRKSFTVENPRLWRGIKDPYRYQIELYAETGRSSDGVEDMIGFRTYEVTRDGFFLNGEKYPLRGVAMHQDFADKGNALTKKEFDTNFRLINEIGANAVRLAHYPHNSYLYELFDRYGIVLWSEIPFVDLFPSEDEDVPSFRENLKIQLVELIRQNYNTSAICFWGLENEVREYYNEEPRDMEAFIAELDALAHEEDPTRLTTQAINHEYAQKNWASDVVAWNAYPGWYGQGTLGASVDALRNVSDRPMGVSEYGAGANPYQHEDDPQYMSSPNTSQWHPEEYQNKLHEGYIRDINDRDWLWGTFVWNMFDFASDTFRNEGSMPGLNNKGLVSHDRTLKKDAFYLYKANWNVTERFSYISSRRYVERENKDTYLKIYSNCDEVTVYLNGQEIGTLSNDGDGIFLFENVRLLSGENTVRAVGRMTGESGEYADETVFIGKDSSSAEIQTTDPSRLLVDSNASEIVLLDTVTVDELKSLLSSENAGFAVTAEGTEVRGEIPFGAELTVTAEDGVATKKFVFAPPAVSFGKSVTASSEETGTDPHPAELVLDYDSSTRWAAAGANFPQNLTVDLGSVYFVDSVKLEFYADNARVYGFQLYAGETLSDMRMIADHSANTVSGAVSAELAPVAARYVRLLVTGSTQGFASVCELKIYGWRLLPAEGCAVGAETGYLYLPESLGDVSEERLASLLGIEGNYSELFFDFAEDSAAEGDTVTVVGKGGGETILTVTHDESLLLPPSAESVNVALGKTAEAVNEENQENNAQNVTDGDTSGSRWAGAGVTGWITVDLGKEYDVSEIALYFYGAGNRAYYFTVEVAGEDGVYTQLADYTQNTDMSGIFRIAAEGSIRYIRVNVSGCSISGRNPSIYEIEAYAPVE